MALVFIGHVVRLEKENSVRDKAGTYYGGIDSGTYGSGYPIYSGRPLIMSAEAASGYCLTSSDSVKMYPAYIDDGT